MDSKDSKPQAKRIQAKGWFLTYPKCNLTKEAALSALEDTGRLKEYVIAQEDHKDGTPHLHAFVKYDRKVYWKEHKWDIGNHHGNYQAAKSWKAAERYCKKGGDFISNINLDNARQKQNKLLLTKTPKQLVDDGDINLLQLPNLIKAKAAYNLLEEAQDKQYTRGIWIYGKPGTEKSHSVRLSEPSLFIKP